MNRKAIHKNSLSNHSRGKERKIDIKVLDIPIRNINMVAHWCGDSALVSQSRLDPTGNALLEPTPRGNLALPL
jgi:hypothetical protein